MLKLKEDKPVFLARVGRNVLYPDVMTVVPEGELTVKMTTAATFSYFFPTDLLRYKH